MLLAVRTSFTVSIERAFAVEQRFEVYLLFLVLLQDIGWCGLVGRSINFVFGRPSPVRVTVMLYSRGLPHGTITQALLDDPNSLLRAQMAGQTMRTC
jgi:hypothetical protein